MSQRPDNISETPDIFAAQNWPSFAEFPEPKMVCLYVGNGAASKPFQAYLDGHPQIYMLPTYPLTYFYPHWEQWREDLKDDWGWPAIIDAFCIKHASILDTRKIPGFNGLTKLGENQDQHLEIDEPLFRAFLEHLLDGQPVHSRTFLLAVHYAYAFCQGEDLKAKRVLVYHIHVPEYVDRYLAPDFPAMLTIGFVRDPRSNIEGRYKNSHAAVDDARLNRTDAVVYARRTYYFTCKVLLEGLEVVKDLDPEKVRVIRSEDLHNRREEVMRALVEFLGIDPDPCLQTLSFGGLAWWGDSIYDMKPMNTFNPRIVSEQWKNRLSALDWFVLEGLFYSYLKKYGYTAYKYKKDSGFERFRLIAALYAPSQIEWRVFLGYLNPKSFLAFLRVCIDEALGKAPLKDYGFNAYYRHRWTNRDLKLWKERWYVSLVRKIQRFSEEKQPLSVAPLRALGVISYTSANIVRYLSSVVLMAVMVVKRANMALAAFQRQASGSNTLPDYL